MARRRVSVSSLFGDSKKVSATNVLRRRTRKKGKAGITAVLPISNDEVIIERMSTGPTPNTFRYGDYLHVSDLLGKCMRMIALSYYTGIKLIGEPLWDNMLMTFAIGNGVHDAVRDKMQKVRPDEMYGVWTCKCKVNQGKFEGTATQALKHGSCNKCGHNLDTYNELVLPNEDIKVIGSVDLTLLFDTAFYFCEIKSIKKEDWDVLKRPLPLHILQVIFYWWLGREKGMPLHQQVSVFYVTKGHVFGTPYKEFVIDPVEHLHRLDEYLEEARTLKASRAGCVLPLQVCPNQESPQARKCEMSTVCFGIEN